MFKFITLSLAGDKVLLFSLSSVLKNTKLSKSCPQSGDFTRRAAISQPVFSNSRLALYQKSTKRDLDKQLSVYLGLFFWAQPTMVIVRGNGL